MKFKKLLFIVSVSCCSVTIAQETFRLSLQESTVKPVLHPVKTPVLLNNRINKQITLLRVYG